MKKENSPAEPAASERRVGRSRRAADAVSPNFSDMIENAAQGIVVHRHFKPLYANHAFAQLFGYDAVSEVMALPLLRPLIPQDLWAQAEQDYDDLVHGRRKAVIARTRGIRSDGQEIWLSVTERAIVWEGRPAVQLNVFDITHHMVMEQNLLRAEQHLRAILEILPYPIYIARRPDGQILFVNRKTCLLFQQSAGQLLRSHSSEFFVKPEERDELRTLLETVPDIRDVEVAMKTGAGRQFTAEIAAIKMEYAAQPAVLVALNDISQRKELEAELFRQASTDVLTGIGNRRHFMGLAEQEMRRAKRFSRAMTVMMLDIDHFKAINDTHGHAVGDAVLQGMVKRSLESLRQSDFIGRLGGEEFGVILPETGVDAAEDVAERLRQHLAERPIVAERLAIPCTVSIGLAQLSDDDKTIDDILHRADQALYRAKTGGRNRVEVAG